MILYFYENPDKKVNYKQISRALGIEDTSLRPLVTECLYCLKDEDKLIEEPIGSFRLNVKGSYATGKIDMTKSGSAYLISPDRDVDIFIQQSRLNRALHGDEVKVYMLAKRRDSEPQAEVVEIIKRNKTTFVGVVEVSPNFAFLIADDKYMVYDIFIPPTKLNGAKQGQKAVAKIAEWPEGAKNPIGEIVEVLGEPGDNEVEMHSILAEFNLPYRFPERLEKQADAISDVITEEEIAKRRDFRSITTLTIDPADAKDFDDALSLQQLPNGNWEVGVHIADVTHYVKPGTDLDKEAFERGTSVYLVDRCVPMLPERLSNNVCSLRPNEEKLTFSAVFELTPDADIVNQWFGRTVINSDKRFAYEEAQLVIDTGEGDMKNEILTLHGLSQKLRARRFKKGSINFESVEVKFKLDENGKPLHVYFKESKESNFLIEEFMLLANKKVAEYVGKEGSRTKKAKTFVYRTHDEPNTEKLATLANFITRFGYTLETDSVDHLSDSMNKLMAEVSGKPEENMISQLAVRAMAKAEYSTTNIGHYGLSFKHYSHFTSPIRRYPDMMVHRLLFDYLNGGSSADQEQYEKYCQHCSEREKLAAQAERTSIKYKQAEFMVDKLGAVFEGIISGVTDWGLYVEIIENKIEGMIPLRELDDDYYSFDDKNYCIVGNRTQRRYTLGDKVKIQVVRVSMERKQLDFKLYRDPETEGQQQDQSQKPLSQGFRDRKAGSKSGGSSRGGKSSRSGSSSKSSGAGKSGKNEKSATKRKR